MSGQHAEILRLFEPGAETVLSAHVRLLHPADIAALLSQVRPSQWARVTAQLSSEKLADVIAELDEAQRLALSRLLKTDRLVSALGELESDDAADVLADLPAAHSEAILEALKDKDGIRSLLSYPQDTAGGIMQTELCRVPATATVKDAVDAVQAARERMDDVLEVYVVDALGRLRGLIALEDLIAANPSAAIASLWKPPLHVLTAELDQEVVARIFLKYDATTLPVVDADNVLLGRVTFDDVHDVLEEEASEDILAIAGASPEELVYGTDVVRIARLRMPWLLWSLGGSMSTGFLLSLFARVPGDAIIMASFVPVVMAMTGNLGSQSAMIVTRGLAIGKVDLSNVGRTLLREVGVGAIIGTVAGMLVGLAAHLWKGNALLGAAIAMSLVCSMTVASFVGVVAPATFKRFGIDPAIASGPLVTTGCDLLGVTFYLVIAIIVLG